MSEMKGRWTLNSMNAVEWASVECGLCDAVNEQNDDIQTVNKKEIISCEYYRQDQKHYEFGRFRNLRHDFVIMNR
jgi:hypothetical protein